MFRGSRKPWRDLCPPKQRYDAKPARDLGEKLRRLRKKCALSITEAARRAQISTGFLSAIELSRANPSVSTIYRLAAAYGTTVLELYDLPVQASRVVRPGNRKSLETKSGVRMELLSTGTKMLESMLIRVPPGTGSDGAYAHQGEDFLYILEGSLEVWLDEVECHILQQHDSFWFESNRGHRWFNPSKKPTVILWVNTPPTFYEHQLTLERESQRELLDPGRRKRSAKNSHRRSICRAVVQRRKRIDVEAHGVGHVEHFPCELDVHSFANFPGLGQPRVDSEISRAAEVVAASGFTDVGKAYRTLCGKDLVLHGIPVGVGKDLRAHQRESIPRCGKRPS